MSHDGRLSPALPGRAIDPAALAARFGAEATALVMEMAASADPLADAAIAALNSGQAGHPAILQAGLREGRASLSGPPEAIDALLRQAESIPPWVDPERIRRGAEAYLSIGALWTSISLGPGSLAHTYSSPAIASVLMATGNLDAQSPRRLLETAVWQQQTLRPGGLAAGAPGYIHTLQVRILHARVRAGLLARGWDTTQRGMPISQLDMLRTWLDFTYVPFNALEKIGIEFDADEFRDLYHVWQLVAHLLGIEDRYYRLVTDQASGAEMLALIDAAAGEPDQAAATLTAKMLDAAAQRLGPALGMPADAAVGLMHAFCRLFHGDDFADKLGVQRNWWSGLMPVFANSNRYQRLLERSDPEVRQRKIAATLAAFDQQIAALEGETTYQHNLSAYSGAGMPRTIAGA
ncbi:oxygenase MpaB family protein [Cupriavidus nantongensis]